jgi:DNA-binding transcriptional MerR regulator
MTYTVNQLAKLAHVSVRTLHYYDEVGLLKPARIEKNGYRYYGEEELLRLQQILFFKELEFPLEEIKRLMLNPNFNITSALHEQKGLIELKRKRLTTILKTIDKTIDKIEKEQPMEDQELYNGLSNEELEAYAKEAEKRWGNTEAYKQSKERAAKMSKQDIEDLKKNGDLFNKKLAASVHFGATSPEFQELVQQHYDSLRMFYEPNLEMYKGLANLYVDDPRFTDAYDRYTPGLAKFMREAMLYFIEQKEKQS